jgi:hypothetical protein
MLNVSMYSGVDEDLISEAQDPVLSMLGVEDICGTEVGGRVR